ncbi:MAG: Mg2+ and Co2+ transporter CorB, partial [candidate division Zixibacteria bacterium]|nr:Mg2+ and Co2+ transporter CorB [candidate division Zixibacteria bacterium]
MEFFVWSGVAVCVIHSGIFSGLNLALFGVTRLRLEVEVASGNRMAERV